LAPANRIEDLFGILLPQEHQAGRLGVAQRTKHNGRRLTLNMAVFCADADGAERNQNRQKSPTARAQKQPQTVANILEQAPSIRTNAYDSETWPTRPNRIAVCVRVGGGSAVFCAVSGIIKLSKQIGGRKAHFFYWATQQKLGLPESAHGSGQIRESIVRQITAIAERVAAANGLEIVEAAMLGGGKVPRLVRIYIDKPEGVSHADCEKVSHEVGNGPRCRGTSFLVGHYQLEVSSPGRRTTALSGRPNTNGFFGVRKPKSYLREAGLKTSGGGKASSRGSRKASLRSRPAAGRTIQFTLDQVEKANLKFEW